MTWQDISTAPKDGTKVLLFYPNVDSGGPFNLPIIVCGRWDSNQYAKRPRPYWENDCDFWGVVLKRNFPPTHWQRLPEPPKE